MEETDLGLDAEPESASAAPKKAAKAPKADPVMDDLLAQHKPSPGAPATPHAEPQVASAGSEPAQAQASLETPPVRERVQPEPRPRTQVPTPTPIAAVVPPTEPQPSSDVTNSQALQATATPEPVIPLPAPLPAPQPRPRPRPLHVVAATEPAVVPPEGPSLPAPLRVREPTAEPEGEVELAAIAGPTRNDLSRSPTLAGNGQWDCPFPSEAKRAGVDSAIVMLRVEVKADSHIESVIVVRDPGDGFGREARRCALAKRWQAGLDREGKAVQRTTVVSVRFQSKS